MVDENCPTPQQITRKLAETDPLQAFAINSLIEIAVKAERDRCLAIVRGFRMGTSNPDVRHAINCIGMGIELDENESAAAERERGAGATYRDRAGNISETINLAGGGLCDIKFSAHDNGWFALRYSDDAQTELFATREELESAIAAGAPWSVDGEVRKVEIAPRSDNRTG